MGGAPSGDEDVTKKTVTIEAVTPSGALLGEGPSWHDVAECLYWVDIRRGEVHRYRAGAGDSVLATLGVPVGAAVPRERGGLLLAAGMGFAVLRESGEITWLATVDAGDRMNDGKCDPRGRFFAGTLTHDRRPTAALYRLDVDGGVEMVLGGLAVSNGLGWSPEGDRFYHIDTPTRRVDVFDYDLDRGSLANRRTFVDLENAPGNPDGLTLDSEGGVWVVLCRGSSVRRFTPEGALDCVIDLPVTRATSCTFGGADLYVTTGTFDLSSEELAHQPLAGAVLRCRPGVDGPPAVAFRG
ncbi:MAG: SMP-30/gluconolactonase/LRE family protein [Acidimicrobiales bacterium]